MSQLVPSLFTNIVVFAFVLCLIFAILSLLVLLTKKPLIGWWPGNPKPCKHARIGVNWVRKPRHWMKYVWCRDCGHTLSYEPASKPKL